jgi:hypothetical protein
MVQSEVDKRQPGQTRLFRRFRNRKQSSNAEQDLIHRDLSLRNIDIAWSHISVISVLAACTHFL